MDQANLAAPGFPEFRETEADKNLNKCTKKEPLKSHKSSDIKGSLLFNAETCAKPAASEAL